MSINDYNYVDNTFNTPAILSFCTGTRGLERGIERAIGTTRTIAYVEIEAFIIENLLAGMEKGLLDAAPIWTNAKTFNAKPFRGKVHIITGGYPCQPFSNAGKRKGADDPRHLWPYLQRIVATIRPVCCFFENVAGHLTLGYHEVYRSLSDMGYAVEAGIFTAEEVGAPHERERLFILAIDKEYLADTRLQRQAQHEQPTAGIEQQGKDDVANTCSIGRDNEQKRYEQTEDDQIGKLPLSEQTRNNKQCGTLQSGNELADTQSQPTRRSPIGAKQKYTIVGKSGNEEMAYSSSEGLERQWERTVSAESEQPVPAGTGINRWPARPGQEQYEWEAPRTIKPGVGCTIARYNYREDFLRALGNAVVEQTAELAFIVLMKKHGI